MKNNHKFFDTGASPSHTRSKGSNRHESGAQPGTQKRDQPNRAESAFQRHAKPRRHDMMRQSARSDAHSRDPALDRSRNPHGERQDPAEKYFNQPRFITESTPSASLGQEDVPGTISAEDCKKLIDTYCSRRMCTVMQLASRINAPFTEVRAASLGEKPLPAGPDKRFERLLREHGLWPELG